VRTVGIARGVDVGWRIALVGLGLALAGGCGSGGGSSTTISNLTLSGKFGGQPWTFVTGATNSLQSTADRYWVDAYSESFTPCTGSASLNADDLILTLPTAVGSYPLSLDLNQTFYVASTGDNFVATRGEIVITEISATTITGGANITYDANNTVDGQFQMTICP
jgi:hypothetical protein